MSFINKSEVKWLHNLCTVAPMTTNKIYIDLQQAEEPFSKH